jgi:hypothetical protein
MALHSDACSSKYQREGDMKAGDVVYFAQNDERAGVVVATEKSGPYTVVFVEDNDSIQGYNQDILTKGDTPGARMTYWTCSEGAARVREGRWS